MFGGEVRRMSLATRPRQGPRPAITPLHPAVAWGLIFLIWPADPWLWFTAIWPWLDPWIDSLPRP